MCFVSTVMISSTHWEPYEFVSSVDSIIRTFHFLLLFKTIVDATVVMRSAFGKRQIAAANGKTANGAFRMIGITWEFVKSILFLFFFDVRVV